MFLRSLLVVLILGFFSQASSATSFDTAKLVCEDISNAGVIIAGYKGRGVTKEQYLAFAEHQFRNGDIPQHVLNNLVWAIKYVYSHQETPDTVKRPLFKACMMSLGFSGA